MARQKKDIEMKNVVEKVNVVEQPEQVQEESTSKQEVKKPTVKTRIEIDPTKSVLVKNITNSTLVYVSPKTQMTVLWTESGDEEYVPVAELLTMRSSQPRFFSEPWVEVLDEDVIDYLGLKEIYSRIIPVEELEDFFQQSPTQIKEQLKLAPKGTKTLIADKAREMIADQTLYDNRVIKILEDELKIDLSFVD